MGSDRLSIRRGEWDCEPPDELPHLISFIMRGGKVKAHVCVDKRLARRYYDDLGELLGEPRSGGQDGE